MNWNKFKDPIPHICLAGAVVVSWPLTQEIAGSNPIIVTTNIFSLNSPNSMKTFRENSITKAKFKGDAAAKTGMN